MIGGFLLTKGRGLGCEFPTHKLGCLVCLTRVLAVPASL